MYISSKAAQGAFICAEGSVDLAALCGGDGSSRRNFPEMLKRPRGRPKGTKDSKPRKVRASRCPLSDTT
jgi:hypothetical protein